MASSLTLVGAAGAVLLFMNILPGLELIVSIKKAPLVAQAALEKATEANDWIAAYIAEQKKQRELDERLAAQAADYQRQMLELQKQQQQYQQQQRPNQAAPTPYQHMEEAEPEPMIYREQDAQGTWWCIDVRDDSTDGENWWACP